MKAAHPFAVFHFFQFSLLVDAPHPIFVDIILCVRIRFVRCETAIPPGLLAKEEMQILVTIED